MHSGGVQRFYRAGCKKLRTGNENIERIKNRSILTPHFNNSRSQLYPKKTLQILFPIFRVQFNKPAEVQR